ncbi:UPF0182 family membrane protein [Ancrocorticia sp.]|uniref:UPF0182 family membrane protein n=1 Tax=Ancrocorticia sp. TaxID=2593684 RepID=UPI003F8E53BE
MFIPTLIVLAVLLFAIVIFSNVWTEVKWYDELDAVRVFWTQWGWALALGVIGTLVVGLVVYLNLRLARPKADSEQDDSASIDGANRYRDQISSHPWLTLFVVPLIAGVIFGAPLSGEWRTYVMWLFRTPFSEVDPQFGHDVSFYVFSLPVLQSLLSLATTLIVLSLIAAVGMHYLYGGIGQDNGKLSLSRRARIHFGVLGAIASLIVAAYFWLSRYNMLLADNEKFAGASFTDINASLPGRMVLAIAALLVGVLFILAAVKGLWKLAGTGIAVGVVTMLVVSWAYPALVQNFQVTPNAVEKESPYIQRNIDATLAAYDLDDIETTTYSARTDAEEGQLQEDAQATAQIRLLDPTIVSPTFNQLQQNRQYYQFNDQLSVDRYNIDDEDRDTVIAVRELNLTGLDDSQRTWVNDHTVYTHGYGVAAAYGNTSTTRGAPQFFQYGIPSTGELGDYEPRVYFGQNLPEYSIVGAPDDIDPWEIDYPDDDAPNGVVYTTYDGNGGPSISNAFEKLMFSIKFRSTDMFFSDRVTDESQILYDRDPQERVSKVAPYLTVDSKAYPAVVDTDENDETPKRLVWIVDAYTTSNNYPYSARASLESATTDSMTSATDAYGQPEEVNYMRNSVKAVVDAYSGDVTLYQWDEDDPVLEAWSKIFPNMLTPVSDMAGDLMSHVRYPEDMFKVQRTLLTQYHVTDAASFYSGGDFWNVPNEPTEGDSANPQQQPPYYLTLQMPGQDNAEFSLSTAFIPGGTTQRNVMTGFLAADANAGNEPGKVRDGYGKLRLLELPRDLTVPGPGQAQNNFLTDSTVSRELNLLRQGGTDVRMGNLLTLPVGGGLLYVQPVYVAASSGTTYPLLQYVLTSFGDGNPIGFGSTLEEALDQTFGGDSGAEAGDADVSGQKEDVTEGEAPDDEATGEPTEAPSEEPTAEPTEEPTGGSAGDAQQRLDDALAKAGEAIQTSNDAMASGDWAAYGQAQEDLEAAIADAIDAKEELEGNG